MARKWNAKAERAKTKQAGQRARNRHRALARDRRYRVKVSAYESQLHVDQERASGVTR
ncbi:MAG: hypothetical protein WBW80_23120 [Acidimicrobiales bacterium]